MKNGQIQKIAYMAIYMALYVVLKMVGNLIPILQMPNGGSIELELIPLMIASYHLGWKYGALCGLASFVLTIALGFPVYFVHPIQIVLDYVLPICSVGMVSLFKPFIHASKSVVVGVLTVIGLCAGYAVYVSYGKNIQSILIAIGLVVVLVLLGIFLTSTKEHFGIVVVMVIKYLSTVLSGAYFWADGVAAGSLPAWTFSLTYNLWYNLVTMMICLVVVPILMSRIHMAGIRVLH
ncbi:MAG: energy-coupled thiamine transporter ThiT [Erysipelotrichaceae bacterium]|nr:energy-coupled thiamine transporter ThiT [Erysipelotrichaceae bacterium]MDY6034254.1 energy-coupled thiamine transporter ThiT [Bulleidia sp.]